MHHRAPETLIEFYSQQIQRGSAGPQFDYLYYKKSKIFIFSKYFIKASICFFNSIIQIYYLYLSFYIIKYEKKYRIF